ncbi:hypothetical protein [Halalkalibacterium ligniniphilum]|uniref:hypothetical protein n=1 Tax=Halalkalibacterium ligniniphilum TaxID=1134413 RepID=UPI00034DCACE|nr:hypothetical protein [Halalkalibacterium ligniniphilum]
MPIIVTITQFAGVFGAILAVYLLTTVFTEIITNNAAAVLMFPISLAIAEQLNVDPMIISYFVWI